MTTKTFDGTAGTNLTAYDSRFKSYNSLTAECTQFVLNGDGTARTADGSGSGVGFVFADGQPDAQSSEILTVGFPLTERVNILVNRMSPDGAGGYRFTFRDGLWDLFRDDSVRLYNQAHSYDVTIPHKFRVWHEINAGVHTIRCYIDDVEIGSWVDSSPLTGGAPSATCSFAGTDRTSNRFDAFSDDVGGGIGSSANPPILSDVEGTEILVDGQTGIDLTGVYLTSATFVLKDGANISVSLPFTVNSDTNATLATFNQGAARYGSGKLIEATNADGTGSIPVTINPPANKKFVNLVSANAVAGERFTSVADLAAGDQIEVSNVIGATLDDIILYDDGSFRAPPNTIFTIRVNNGEGWGAEAIQTVQVVAPTITQQPQNTTVQDGQNAAFSVVATGATPLTYQWKRNGVDIAGATSASLSFGPVSFALDNGAQFTCVVTNPAGTATSSAATLTVQAQQSQTPVITQQPASTSKNEGETATFTVVANFASTYQWRKNGVAIPGATSSSYTTGALTSADNGALYDCVITGTGGSVTSSAAVLTVVSTPSNYNASNVVIITARMKRALSRKADTSLDADILDELNWAQERLEAEKSKPYFLRKWVTVQKDDAHEFIDLMTEIPGFLKLCEYRPVQVLNPDIAATAEPLMEIELLNYEQLIDRQMGTGSAETLPTKAALVGTRLFLRTRQLVSRTYVFYVYVREVQLTANGSNFWTQHAADLLMGEAGMSVAQSLRDDKAIAWFTRLRQMGYGKVMVADADLDYGGHDLTMGGED